MNELEASRYATLFAARWPGRLQAQVEPPVRRTDGNGYVVRLTLPRENRILRLARERQLRGIQSICLVLLGEPVQKRKRMQQIEKTMEEPQQAPEPAAPEKPKRTYRRSVPREQAELVPVEASPAAPAPVGEEQVIHALIAYAFRDIAGIVGFGRLAEVPRTWKFDITTVRGPESYRITRNVDGSFQHERW